jgi:hypothetical protein
METMHQTPYALPLCGELVAEGLQLRYYATTSFDGEDEEGCRTAAAGTASSTRYWYGKNERMMHITSSR